MRAMALCKLAMLRAALVYIIYESLTLQRICSQASKSAHMCFRQCDCCHCFTAHFAVDCLTLFCFLLRLAPFLPSQYSMGQQFWLDHNRQIIITFNDIRTEQHSAGLPNGKFGLILGNSLFRNA